MKFCVIGLGSMGGRRVRHLLNLKAGEVFGYDFRKDRREQTEKEFHIKTITTKDDLVDFNPDAIMICVPPSGHLEYMKMAVDHNWHFMVEIPLYHKISPELNRVIDLVKTKDLIANVSCNMRFREGIKKVREIIEQEVIGPILTGQVEIGEWLPDWHPWEPYKDYYPSSNNLGGGLDIIVDLDWVVDIFGKIKKHVCLASKKTSLDIDTNDIMQMLIEFENGPQLFIHSDMIQRPYRHCCRFHGERGTLYWDASEKRVGLYRTDKGEWEYFEETQWKTYPYSKKFSRSELMYLEDTEHFLKCLKGGATPLNSLSDNRDLLEVTLKGIKIDESYNE